MKSENKLHNNKVYDWIETDIASFAPFVYGKGLPEEKRNHYGHVPVYGSNGIIGFHDMPLVVNPAVIIGRKGTVGAVHFCEGGCWPIDTTFYHAGEDVDSVRYAYYVLKSVGLNEMNSDSAVPGLNRDNAHTIIIRIPSDVSEQRRIAHILGTLDDKIENNRKTAKTLEAMAQAIFKSWFVDFDPVRAKMAGESRDSICKRLKLTPEILDLFPDRLVDSELGEIPEGWHNKAISEIVKRVSVGTKYDTKKVFEIGKVPVLDQGKSGIIGYHNGTPDIHASPTNPIIIFANHTCYMRLIPYDFSVIQNVLPFYGDGVDTIWAYFATRDKISFSEYKGHWPDFILEPVIVPSKALTTYFRTIISDLISAIFVADAMNEPISKTRDTLLPKLISGELRVSDPALLI